MKYVAAYLMLVLGGNDAPTADDVTALLSSVGIAADEEKLKAFAESIVGKDVSETLAAGLVKMKDMPIGGGGGGGGAAAAGGAPAAEEKKEEEEEEEEEAAEVGGLFGGDDDEDGGW